MYIMYVYCMYIRQIVSRQNLTGVRVKYLYDHWIFSAYFIDCLQNNVDTYIN